jgi:hypothetical protein
MSMVELRQLGEDTYDCFVRLEQDIKHGHLLHKDLLTKRAAAFHELKPSDPQRSQGKLLLRDKVDDQLLLNPYYNITDPFEEQNDKKSVDLGFHNQFLYQPKNEDIRKRLAKQEDKIISFKLQPKLETQQKELEAIQEHGYADESGHVLDFEDDSASDAEQSDEPQPGDDEEPPLTRRQMRTRWLVKMQTKAAKDNLKSWMKLTRKSVTRLREEQAAVDRLQAHIRLTLKAAVIRLADNKRPANTRPSNQLGLGNESSSVSRNG